ncbi:MAG: inositol monophosphatase family protein [Bacteroidota bacterium]
MNLKALCDAAKQPVKEAAVFIREQRKSFSQSVVEYKGFNDLVSYVDKNAEQLLVERLKIIFPEAGFITEENTAGSEGQDYNWIIDPLDGTTNFVHGLPCFCVSVALAFKGTVVLGIIHEINLDECFYAWQDGGAWMNGNRIYVSPISELKKSLLATGFPYTNFSRMKEYMEVFDYCMRNTHGLRRLGSAAVDMAYVACGRLEGFYEYGLNAWDIAAGCCIIKEAGGSVADFSGGDNFLFGKELVATNSGIYNEFLSVVKDKFNS